MSGRSNTGSFCSLVNAENKTIQVVVDNAEAEGTLHKRIEPDKSIVCDFL